MFLRLHRLFEKSRARKILIYKGFFEGTRIAVNYP